MAKHYTPINEFTTYPLIYKMIPTQWVFIIYSDGSVNCQIAHDIPSKMKFDTLKKARAFIKKYKEHI